MKKSFLIAVAIAMLVASPLAIASGVETKGLTAEQVRELNAQAAKMRSNENVSSVVRKEAAAWAEMGQNLGVAMVSAARELGVAANEFSQTSLGKVVTVMVVYKLVGQDMLGLVVGGSMLIFGLGLSFYICVSNAFADVKYEYKPVLFGLYNKKVVASVNYSSDASITKGLSAIGSAFVGLVIGLNCIF